MSTSSVSSADLELCSCLNVLGKMAKFHTKPFPLTLRVGGRGGGVWGEGWGSGDGLKEEEEDKGEKSLALGTH